MTVRGAIALAAEVEHLERELVNLRSAQVTHYCQGCEERQREVDRLEAKLAALGRLEE